MARFVVRRVLWLLLVLLIISLVTFLLMHLVPGGPWARAKPLPPAVIAAIDAKYGLNKPLYIQYAKFLWGILHGDLGISYSYQDRSVTQIYNAEFSEVGHIGGHCIYSGADSWYRLWYGGSY